MKSLRHGFTLIELLVVIAIIAILAGLGLSGYSAVTEHAKKTKEISAAKALITGYCNFPTDNGGAYMLGYDKTASGVEKADGESVNAAASHRYPWRLAPYFDYKMDGTILVNENKNQVELSDSYQVSLYPALGINAFYVGGYRDESNISLATEPVTAMGQTSAALLVFASASYGTKNSGGVSGFHLLEPPAQYAPMWSDKPQEKGGSSDDYGHVDARYNGRAVCAYLDGSVKMQTIEELRDMRLWNKNAYAQNNPDYTVRQAGSNGQGGGRGRGE